ncbi:MAG TPA: MqnA/MqnD/SBP family protein [Candidatus Eisenbacteria bacterium]|nr:MqnA/MqnD/SBP family protein [Candidatus Eisenbacteria bacterium]
MKRRLTLGHSPDPDDAFMFYALASGKIDTGDLELVHQLEDIETLNQRALREELDITAVSLHAYAYLQDRYLLLPHGASMGIGYGPMVVARRPMAVEDLKRGLIAVPGTMTTAFLALRLAIGAFRFRVVPFDRILDAVAAGDADAGLIIHEGQLTYRNQGLEKILDLGAWWSERTQGMPLPLGGNAIRRSLGPLLISRVSKLLKASILYGLEHRQPALTHALAYARDMERDQADTFVGMYVNDLTVDYGEEGRRAVERLLTEGFEAGIVPGPVRLEFA